MDYSVLVPKKPPKKPEKEAAPPPSPKEVAHPREVGPYMNGYISHLDQIHRLKNIEFTHSRSLRMNFGGYRDDFDDYYYGYGPDYMYNEVHHYPLYGYPDHGNGHGPPPPLPSRRYPFRPPLPPGLPPPSHYVPGGPPPAGYPPCGFFNDENPNGCTVM